MKSRFEEIKIKMVMKLRGVSRSEAMKMIRLGICAEASGTRPNAKKIKSEDAAAATAEACLESDGEELLSAEEFFKM